MNAQTAQHVVIYRKETTGYRTKIKIIIKLKINGNWSFIQRHLGVCR